MANFDMEYVACPVCKGQKTAKIYRELDVTGNNKLRDKILKDELFRYKCNNCGYEDQNNYPFLYTDIDDKLLVWHIPMENRENISEIVDEINKENDLREKNDTDFIFRVVGNLNELKEKIILRNLKLDDKVMEVVKLFYLNSIMLSENPLDLEKLFGIYFNVANGKWQLCFTMEDEETLFMDISEETYKDVEKLSKEVIDKLCDEEQLKETIFCIIDKNFGEKIITELLKK